MSVKYFEENRIFKLDSKNTSYVIKIFGEGYPLHLYFGAYIPDVNLTDFEKRNVYASFSAWPEGYEPYTFTPDTYPMEIGCNGGADMRIASVQIRNSDGNAVTDMRYVSHKIYKGKPALKGLPALYANTPDECETLELTLRDSVTGAECILLYTVFEKHSAITRSMIIKNTSEKSFVIERAMSFCLDMNSKDYDLITLYGRHYQERDFERRPLAHGTQGIGSRRGSSSAAQNPFMALISKNGNEDFGEAYGFNLVYSANFKGEIEVDYNNSSRVIMGINYDDFGWTLEPGDSFYTPEAALVYSNEGLGGMSRTFHRLYNNNLIRGEWKNKKRPLLVNNWEGTGMDFDDEKLLNIAKWAKETGIEMFVMDDGWFGKRNDDTSSLGDWTVNEEKLGGGIGSLVSRVKALGLKFGIWYEPEMISPNSDLYREHPDWCIHVPGRKGSIGRHQLVIDMSRKDVRDYLFNIMSEVLEANDIDYLKWDFNRNITEAGSALLPKERQKEFYHRFILGTYELMDRITSAYPHILMENCSGGGGRYDPGMMYYSPQIWCSDNTDALSRVDIQFGSSLCYPASVQGAHVSASSRSSYETKRNVAMWGSFGYELDPEKISEEARNEIKTQISDYHRHYDLIHSGDLYRIISPWDDPYRCAWEFVCEDKSKVLLTVLIKFQKEPQNFFIRLKGLSPDKYYRLEETGEVYSGALLMNAGISLFNMKRSDGYSKTFYFEEV
ncbi:MAG: alpha-galactosidase [Oscillospiraceae bacterium]|nr:alpha-galactosidase [Oscillospiraceae bacterium]